MERANIIEVAEEGAIIKAKDTFRKFKGRDFRQNQLEVIRFAIESPKPVVVIEAPTGSGKSLVGSVLCKLSKDSIYLVHSKTLQDQIMEDFPEFEILKGRANYPCILDMSVTCADCQYVDPSRCKNHGRKCASIHAQHPDIAEMCNGKDRSCRNYEPNCSMWDYCTYPLQKKKVVKHPLRVLNYSYYLTEANYVGQFSGIPFVVCDEADVLENELLGFIQISISDYQMRRFGVSQPRFKTSTAKDGVASWKEWAAELSYKVTAEIESKRKSGELSRKDSEYYGGILSKLKAFMGMVDKTWIYDVVGNEGTNRHHVFKPVWITPDMTSDYLRKHSEKIVLMSATFPAPGAIAKTLGIPLDDMDYMEVPSNFRVENRPIYMWPVINVSAKTSDDDYRKLMDKIVEIINFSENINSKGMIHTCNYKLARMVMQLSPRMLGHVTENRNEVLEKFKESSEPLILVSPSMERGISLNDDLARWMIITKASFPDLNDKQVSARLYGSRDGKYWYDSITAQTIEQMCGRATRHKDDTCRIYMLDGHIERIVTSHPRMFSGYFRECLV